MQNLLTGPTKCLLVRPEFLAQTFYNLADVVRLLGAKSAAPPLGLLIVASLLPKHWELRFIDGDVEPITDADIEWADIVMVGGIGPQHETILAVIDRAHAKGKPVVVGGSGATLQPESYPDADFVVAGEAENTLPRLLEDLGKGVTSGLYKSPGPADVSNPVVPRYDLAKLDKYMFIGVAFSRGCPFACEFCAQIEIFGRTPRCKTVEQVLADLQTIYDLGFRGMIDFGYDNLIGDIPKATEVLEAMYHWAKRRGHPFCYSTEATINLAREKRVLELMRDNDFRYVFVGIESGDDDVLNQTKKGQNTAFHPSQATKIFYSYGLIVYTGLILGFDAETDSTAENILKMVQSTGAFPALVLPLHALPSTQLSRRMAREGRLFGEGELTMNTMERTDTATTGLNFVTARPRTRIMRDLAYVLENVFDSQNHYARIRLMAEHFRPEYKYRPSFRKLLGMAKSFVEIALTTGISKDTGYLYWSTLIKILFTNFGAAEMVIGLAAMHTNYAFQAKSYVRALNEQIAIVEKLGEEEFNARMLAKAPALPAKGNGEPLRTASPGSA